MQLQVTLFDERGKYKPVSTLVEMPKKEVIAKNFKPYRDKGVQKICAKHYWTAKDIKKYFTQVKIRIYNEEKVKAEKENRYNEIKRQKFASGEWKPSKRDIEKGLADQLDLKKFFKKNKKI